MAQITVQDVYNGAKYDVMSAAVADYLKNGRPAEYDERTWMDITKRRNRIFLLKIIKSSAVWRMTLSGRRCRWITTLWIKDIPPSKRSGFCSRMYFAPSSDCSKTIITDTQLVSDGRWIESSCLPSKRRKRLTVLKQTGVWLTITMSRLCKKEVAHKMYAQPQPSKNTRTFYAKNAGYSKTSVVLCCAARRWLTWQNEDHQAKEWFAKRKKDNGKVASS